MDEYTQSVFDRCWTESARKELLAYAAKFVRHSKTRAIHGVDAAIIRDKAVAQVCAAGFPNPTAEPIAYLKTVIKNVGINSIKRRENFQKKEEFINHHYAMLSAITQDEPTARLERDDDQRDFENALMAHKRPIPEIIAAIRDNPECTMAEIAALADTSESTVHRAKKAIRQDNAMRELFHQIASSSTDLAEPQERI